MHDGVHDGVCEGVSKDVADEVFLWGFFSTRLFRARSTLQRMRDVDDLRARIGVQREEKTG